MTVSRAVMSWAKTLWTSLNEVTLNINTVSAEHERVQAPRTSSWWRGPTGLSTHDDNYGYASPDYWYIRKIVRVLSPSPQDVCYDLGAGMGRVVCVMATRTLSKCVGVELIESLCEAARSNARRLRWRRTPIEIVCRDVVDADLSDGTIYVLFNPFGEDTIRDVLANIEMSLSTRPREVKFVYYNSAHENLFAECAWLELFHAFRTFGGLRVSFWRTT